ncbi:late secretory pathway protein [Planoprotostelium fungivorum]|uniref:Late secretory pathway protein n=1 Tax=Planoprotostelium fungivorum TaxID=1890364 RepID=A0A2P6NHT8_9EUKA|nr:late secretory pathway protein [Planoprotostelium fungivorum]
MVVRQYAVHYRVQIVGTRDSSSARCELEYFLRQLQRKKSKSTGIFNPHSRSDNPSISDFMDDFHQLTGDEVIAQILVIGFHHQIGHVIEFAYPEMPKTNDGKFIAVPQEWSMVPYIALPDGAHLVEQDAVFFNVPSIQEPGKTLYGVASYRQMSITKLITVSEDIKRPMIQKAVVVLSRYPVYGAIEERLRPITLAFFEQGDFTMTEILVQAFETMNHQLSKSVCLQPATLTVGLSLRQLVDVMGRNVLNLLKLILLGQVKIVLFNVSPVQNVSSAIFALLSLLPGSIQQGLSLVDVSEEDHQMIVTYGLPFQLFREDNELIAYAPINQFDIMKSKKNFLAGATNSLYLRNPPFEGTLVVVNLSNGDVVPYGAQSKLATLSTRDGNFMEELIEHLAFYDKQNNAAEPVERYEGSDDWIRDRFKVYLKSLLSTVASIPGVLEEKIPDGWETVEGVADFNTNWVRAFLTSQTFQEWKTKFDPSITQVPHEHPGAKGLAANFMDGISALKVASEKKIQEANLNAKAANAYDVTSAAATKTAAVSAAAAATAAAKVSQFVQDNGPGAKAAVATGWSSLMGAVNRGIAAANTAVQEYQQKQKGTGSNVASPEMSEDK